MAVLSDLDNFYLQHSEPVSETLLALKAIILKQDKDITAAWKYRMPFFCYKGKMFCYLWVHKATHQSYIGIVEGKHIEHPDLIIERRSRMKIMLFDVNEDLPVDTIENILQQALDLYKSGIISPLTPKGEQLLITNVEFPMSNYEVLVNIKLHYSKLDIQCSVL